MIALRADVIAGLDPAIHQMMTAGRKVRRFYVWPAMMPGFERHALMSSTLFATVRLLEKLGHRFFIERTRPDTIRLSMTLVGERMEIDVFEDDHLEFSRFRGDESVESGYDELMRILQSQTSDA
ncbi:hypothetical protein [Bradyrhizobium sp. USDA 4353]